MLQTKLDSKNKIGRDEKLKRVPILKNANNKISIETVLNFFIREFVAFYFPSKRKRGTFVFWLRIIYLNLHSDKIRVISGYSVKLFFCLSKRTKKNVFDCNNVKSSMDENFLEKE